MAHPEVNTKLGRLRGQIQKNIEGQEFFSFKGIPYAKPPVGKLKFQDPVPIEPWTGTREALEFGPVSAQYDMLMKVFMGSDDCLYLNVYTKNFDTNALRPVMVWIHGGGFLNGSGNDTFYGPDYLMTKDIVLVTINYRLGIYGFLNLDHELALGNQGLKDQVMALQWVRDNIKNFGGDPGNVTIFGESAGGASVHFLTMSPMAKGLFHKAIAQSGVAINPWAISVVDQKEMVYKICIHLGKKTTDPVEIVELLKNYDALELVKIQEKLCHKEMSSLHNIFSPIVDNKSSNPFFPISMDIAIKQGANVPFLLGHTDREAIILLQIMEREFGRINRDNFTFLIHPYTLEELKKYNLTIEDLKRMYLSKKYTSDLECIVNMCSDLLFLKGIHEIIKNQVENNAAPTYMYQFEYDKGYSLTETMPISQHMPGASHLDEALYLFNMKALEPLNLQTAEKGTLTYRVMEQMLELWTNFAKTGMPTPAVSELVPVYWKPVIDGTVFRYLSIGEELRMEKMLNINERFSYKENTDANI